MNIDLLFTQNGGAGLIASENFVKKMLGVVLDTKTGLITAEFNDGDYMETNIPVEGEYYPTLDHCAILHIGAVKNGNIAQAYQAPLMFADDPYRNQAMQAVQPKNPLASFGYFLKSCVFGQPVHRGDLGNESTMGCILGDATPSSLQFAPHLARQHQMEIRPGPSPAPQNVPGMGLGGSSGGGSTYTGGSNMNSGRGNHNSEDDR